MTINKDAYRKFTFGACIILNEEIITCIYQYSSMCSNSTKGLNLHGNF